MVAQDRAGAGDLAAGLEHGLPHLAADELGQLPRPRLDAGRGPVQGVRADLRWQRRVAGRGDGRRGHGPVDVDATAGHERPDAVGRVGGVLADDVRGGGGRCHDGYLLT